MQMLDWINKSVKLLEVEDKLKSFEEEFSYEEEKLSSLIIDIEKN